MDEKTRCFQQHFLHTLQHNLLVPFQKYASNQTSQRNSFSWIFTCYLLIACSPVGFGCRSTKNEFYPEADKSHTDDLISLVSELWELDGAQIRPETDYKLNLQGKLEKRIQGDKAKDRLFTSVKWSTIRRVPTVSEFLKLLDNYEPVVGISEELTTEKQLEVDAFLDAVIKTPVMRRTHQFLVDRGLSKHDLEQFKQQLFSIWFEPYKRRRSRDSSAFEHVFVGEQGYNQLLGLHNWIQFAEQEAQNKIDYQGYYATCGTPGGLATVSFRLPSGLVKPRTSFPIGTTPAFEMALYTATFLTSDQRPQSVRLGPCTVTVQCHSLRNTKKMGTCYLQLPGVETKLPGTGEDETD